MTQEELMLKVTELQEELTNANNTIIGLNEQITNSNSTIETLTTDLEKSKADTKFYFDKVINQFDKTFGRETPNDVAIEEELDTKSKDESLTDIVNLF